VFEYDPALASEYPTIRAGVLHAAGLVNGPSPPGLVTAYRAEQEVALARLDHTPPAELPSLAAWRRVFTRFGAKPTQHRSAPEALLRRLGKHGDIPTIGALVDIGNLVSIRYALPVAVFDLAHVAAPISVRFATGVERFTDLGARESVPPPAGEVVFVDADDMVCARRWCWRQSAQSATGLATTEALYVVEGQHETAAEEVASAVEDLAALLAVYQPASRADSRLLSPAEPAFG
jgi:DNA/RNA-binding domain of Phe-tRNA-synthetase-like protein